MAKRITSTVPVVKETKADKKSRKKVKEFLTQEELDHIEREAYRSVTFDAHFVTGKIVEFGVLLTGQPLYGYQKMIAYRIIYAVITFEGALLTMILARQSGKSETLAFVANALCVLVPALSSILPDLEPYKKGIRIGIFAPQSDQVWNTYNRALDYLNTEIAEEIMADDDLQVGLVSKRYQLSNGSKMVGQVASKQSKIEGATYDIVFVEEAQDVEDEIVEKSIGPMLTSTNGTMVKCGTTGKYKNHYWYDIQKNRTRNRSIHDERLLNHWEFDYLKIIKHRRDQYNIDKLKKHLYYEIYVLGQRDRYGKDSTSFKLSYALEWDLESGMLISDKEFDALTNNKKGHSIAQNDVVIAGLDIGKDDASTILTLGKLVWEPNDENLPHRIEMCGWLELKNVDYELQHQLIVDYLYDNNVCNLFADYTGVGKPVVDRLRYAVGDSVNIEPYTFSMQSKSEMWFNMIDYIQTKRLIIPANSKIRGSEKWRSFEEQMKNCTKGYNGPYLVCQKSEGYHDDYVDSLALMLLANSFEQTDDDVEEYENPFFQNQINNRKLRSNNSWK